MNLSTNPGIMNSPSTIISLRHIETSNIEPHNQYQCDIKLDIHKL